MKGESSTAVSAATDGPSTAATTGGGRNSRSTAPTKATSTAAGSQHRQLSKIQSQQVDAAFKEIFGYPWGTVFSWRGGGQPTASSSQEPAGAASSSSSSSQLTSEQIVLAKVIGKKRAAQLLLLHPSIGGTTTTTSSTTTGTNFYNKDRGVIRKHQSYKHKTDTSASSSITKAASSKRAPAGGGSSIISKDSTMPPAAVVAAGGGGGMDQLLHEMSQSNKVTTTAKTAADWESFKATAGPGLGDKLEEYAESKGAYLKRQDFLTRVDQRQFEKEKAEREQTRAARDR
jgi:Bucentaur or craniofacial development